MKILLKILSTYFIAYLIFWTLLHEFGAFPTDWIEGNFNQAIMVYVLKGAVTASIWVMPPALVADALENGMLDGSGDDAGLYMSLYFFSQKSAMALGVGVAFPLVQFLGFSPQAGLAADFDGLLKVALLLPGIVALPAIFLLFNYPIDEKRHGEIREELRQRGVSNV